MDSRSGIAGEGSSLMGSENTLDKSVMHDVDDNQRPTVVKDIAHIYFTALLILNLGGNWIESIEGLARVQMPYIQRLRLCAYGDNTGDNKISSVGVMKKAAWPTL